MKKEEFKRLVEDVADCHICQHLPTLPHAQNSERLENDDHGLTTEHPYVNRWNIWQGNLNADIMVIGQDYGIKEDGDTLAACDFTSTLDPTGCRLKTLFKQAFDMDVDTQQDALFFTNMANCYRKQKTSGGAHPAWLPICAHKFMARLIGIVQPKIIIVLGRAAFEALHCMENMPVTCLDPVEKGKDSFAETIACHYELDLNGSKIAVFPVYHPGANSNINRSEEQQIEDWKRIFSHYMKVRTND